MVGGVYDLEKAVTEAEKKLEAITGPTDQETDEANPDEDTNKKDKKREKK
jgi:hypothetical protein